MDAKSQSIKLKRSLSQLPSYNLLQKTRLISNGNDTVTSSIEIKKASRKDKTNNLNKSII